MRSWKAGEARHRGRSRTRKIDTELSGVDGRGGVEAELRKAIAEVLDEILPEVLVTVREGHAAAAWHDGRASTGHDQEWNMVHYDVPKFHGRHPPLSGEDRGDGDR